MVPFLKRARSLAAISATAIAFALSGCSGTPENIHPVAGHVEATGGDATTLTGHILETRLQSDPLVRSSGLIAADGSFSLETLHQGEIVNGAMAGNHQVRVVLSDDDPEAQKRAKKALDPKYFDFDKSGLQIAVPSDDPRLQLQLR